MNSILLLMIITWAVSFSAGYYLFKRLVSPEMYYPNMQTIFFWMYSVTISLAPIFFYMEIHPYSMSLGVIADQYTIQAHFLIQSLYFIFPIGMLLSNVLFKYKASDFQKYLDAPLLTQFRINEKVIINIIFAIMLPLATFKLYFLSIELGNILAILQGDIAQISYLQATRGEGANIMFGIPIYRINYLMYYFYPILIICGYIYIKNKKMNNIFSRYFIYLNIGIYLMGYIGVGKANYFDIIILIVLLRFYVDYKSFTIKKFIGLGIMLIGVGTLLMNYFMQGGNLYTSASWFFYRFFLTQARTIPEILKLIGTGQTDLLGSSVLPVYWGINTHLQIDVGDYIQSFYPTSGHAISIFFSEPLLGFGVIGAIVSMIIAGFISQSLHVYLTRISRKTPLLLACYIFFSIRFPRGAHVSFSNFVISVKWYYTLIMIFLIIFSVSIIIKASKKASLRIENQV